MTDLYEGPVEAGMTFKVDVPASDGKPARDNFRVVKVLCRHPDMDDMLVMQEEPSWLSTRHLGRVGRLFLCPEHNLRVVFEPADV